MRQTVILVTMMILVASVALGFLVGGLAGGGSKEEAPAATLIVATPTISSSPTALATPVATPTVSAAASQIALVHGIWL